MAALSKKYREPIVYGLLSAQSFLLNILFMAFLCDGFKVSKALAYPISVSLLIVINFFACRQILFRVKSGSMIKQFISFLVSIIGWRIFEYIAYLILVYWLNVHYLIAVVVVSTVSVTGKFFSLRYYIFKT